MAPTTIKVTVEQVTRLFRSERMPGAGEVRLVEIPPWDEFTIESEDWTARGYLSRIFVEGLIEHPPLVCLSVKRWDDEEWTGMAMTPDEARSLAAHLLALAGPDPEEQVEAGPEHVIEHANAASTPVARGRVTVTQDGLSVDFADVPKGVGLNVHDLERPAAPTDTGVLADAPWAARVVETDNYGGDYPDESFHGPPMPHADAERIAAAFNKYADDRRYYKVVPMDYKLAPGFEP